MFKYMFVCFLHFNFFLMSENTTGKHTIIVSLGENCQVGIYLKDQNLRYESFPLDWVVTPFDSLVKFINNEGNGFLEKDHLLFNNGIWEGAAEVDYGMHLPHEFTFLLKENDLEPTKPKKFSEIIVLNYLVVKKKYDRRIKRFFDLLKSNKKILFIRVGISKENAISLDKLLHSKYPNLEYTIAAVDGNEEMKQEWNLERIKNFYIDRSQSIWLSPKEEWIEILNVLKVDVEFGESKTNPSTDEDTLLPELWKDRG